MWETIFSFLILYYFIYFVLFYFVLFYFILFYFILFYFYFYFYFIFFVFLFFLFSFSSLLIFCLSYFSLFFWPFLSFCFFLILSCLGGLGGCVWDKSARGRGEGFEEEVRGVFGPRDGDIENHKRPQPTRSNSADRGGAVAR